MKSQNRLASDNELLKRPRVAANGEGSFAWLRMTEVVEAFMRVFVYRSQCIERIGMAMAIVFFASGALAQTINIWPGIAPGSENWTQKEVTIEMSWGTVLENVVTPTLTAYLPEKSKATGTGVIVAPGGACIALAMKHEGSDVATWLQERGIAAFVLKSGCRKTRGREFLRTEYG